MYHYSLNNLFSKLRIQILFFLLFFYGSNVFAQLGKKFFLKLEGGKSIFNSSNPISIKYEQLGFDREKNIAPDVYHLAGTYNLNIHDLLEIGLGTRFDYLDNPNRYHDDFFLNAWFAQTVVNLNKKPQTMYLFSQYGIGFRFSNVTDSGNIFRAGLGWKFRDDKGIGISAGYNITNVNNLARDKYTFEYFDLSIFFAY